MYTRIHVTVRCALRFFALFAAIFVTALLVDPAANLTHWVESAGYAAGVSLTALLLDALLNLTGKRPLFPSMLLDHGFSDAGQVGDEQAWAVLNHRRELLAERLCIDTSCTCARSSAPCDEWPFCAEDRDVIVRSGMADGDLVAPGCGSVENGDEAHSPDTEHMHHEADLDAGTYPEQPPGMRPVSPLLGVGSHPPTGAAGRTTGAQAARMAVPGSYAHEVPCVER